MVAADGRGDMGLMGVGGGVSPGLGGLGRVGAEAIKSEEDSQTSDLTF